MGKRRKARGEKKTVTGIPDIQAFLCERAGDFLFPIKSIGKNPLKWDFDIENPDDKSVINRVMGYVIPVKTRKNRSLWNSEGVIFLIWTEKIPLTAINIIFIYMLKVCKDRRDAGSSVAPFFSLRALREIFISDNVYFSSRGKKELCFMRFALSVITAVLLMCFAGCATAPSEDEDKELSSLVSALVENSIQMKKKAAEQAGAGIATLTFDKASDKITADLQKASVAEAVRRLFEESGKSYLLDKVELRGNITVRFDKLPFSEGLNLILEPGLLSSEINSNGLVVIKSGLKDEEAAAVPATAAEPGGTPAVPRVFMEVALENMDTDTAIKLLDTLFPSNMMTGGRPLDFGVVPSSSTVYLNGPKELVSKTAQLLIKADSEIRHILIEVLVVEFDTGALEELGTRIRSLQDGQYQDVNIDFTGMSSDYISFTKLPSDIPNVLTTFSASVNFLMSDNKARLISRPYIAALSGKEADIQIASERYVNVANAAGGVSEKSISAGVLLKMTPVVKSEGNLQMTISVEDSQFSAINVPNVVAEVNKNAANTVMQVKDGQTIIIGGLVSNRRSWGNYGFPFLRKIPIVNWIFGSQESDFAEKEVAIYVTPHIWKPGMISPLIEPNALKSDKESGGVMNLINKLK